MKFLCDRCKTRYSIGDDRVRGKILKIRCKNCANVITVREGMTDLDASEPAAPGQPQRRQKQTTMAPVAQATSPAPGAQGALGSAFASAMTKPPAALEEEWYVSIDGDQSGPFSLAEAQRWVAGKDHDADLHCWSEGFDDWLPVDKVSHFRGLRKKPAPAAAPPPLPRAGTGAQRAIKAPVEEEPKPLFAATMASLEKSAPAASSQGMQLPSLGGPRSATPVPTPVATPRSAPLAPSAPVQVKSNGNAAVKIPAFAPAIPSKAGASGSMRAPTTPGPGVSTRMATFDVGDSATQIESPPFEDERATAAEPVAAAAKRVADTNASDAFVKALGSNTSSSKANHHAAEPASAPPPSLASLSASAPMSADLDQDNDDDALAIGEVSRVVNLADLMRTAKPKAERPNTAAFRRSGPIAAGPLAARATGINPNLAQVPVGGDPANGANGMLNPNAINGETAHDLAAQPTPAVSHRRGMIILLGVAGALLAGVVIAVVVLVGNTDSTDTGLRDNGTIDTTRPDDPLHKAQPQYPIDPANPFAPPKPPVQRPRYTGPANPNPHDPNLNLPPDGKSLRADEVEAEVAKHSLGTQRCYMRSQKGADAILVGDVKKIAVTMTIDKAGTVTDVSLSEHGNDSLGKCLSSQIRGWKFRESSNGITTRITMVFQSG